MGKVIGKVLGILILAYLILSLVSNSISNDNWHWDYVARYLFDQTIISGVLWTLLLTLVSMAIGGVLAFILALMRINGGTLARGISYGFIWFFRGTPVYTQLIFWGLVTILFPKIMFGIPFTDISFFAFDSKLLFSALICAILGLSLNEAAYLAEIFRSGILSVPKGQFEAGKVIGLSDMKVMLKIVVPQSLKVIIPPTGNEAISMLKTTSLVVAVPFTMELTYVQSSIANRFFLPVPLLIVAAAWYLAITSILMVGQHFIEKKFGKGVVVGG